MENHPKPVCKEDVAFLHNHGGYHRLFVAIRRKYHSLGRLGGHVVLGDLTSEEKDVLSSHLRRSYEEQQSARVSVAKFADSLADTRFAGYTLQQLLEGFFGEPLVSRLEEQQEYLANRKAFFRRQKQKLSKERTQFPKSRHRSEEASPPGHSSMPMHWGRTWLNEVDAEVAFGLRRLQQMYQRDANRLAIQMQWVANALDLLEQSRRYWRLPLLAAEVTKDPHSFDLNGETGLLFLDALCTLLARPGYQSRQDMLECLFDVGVLGDEITNFVTCTGLLAADAQGKVLPIWQAALDTNEVLQVPLAWLAGCEQVWVADGPGPLGSNTRQVFVVENAGVFSALRDGLLQNGVERAPLICTHGQIKLAGILVLERLAQVGTTIRYSGDFDPEGLGIAQALAQRFPKQFQPWHWSEEDWQRCRSNNTLSGRRIAMLQNISHPGLQSAAECIASTGLAGYQEALLPDLLADVIDYASAKVDNTDDADGQRGWGSDLPW